ncbi:MAG: teichoic acid D-Ala incorporation-associated protein DltX [Vagococcus sp.]
MKKMVNNETSKYWLSFTGKTVLYVGILLVLVYLYQYSHVGGGSFIYNQF